MRRRRRLILQSLAAALATLPSLARGVPIGPDARLAPGDLGLREPLRAFVDTLIPADETPAASALGVDQALLDSIRRDPAYRRLIEAGVDWLERSARRRGAKSFAAATEKQRIAIVERAERADPGTAPRLLFDYLRTDAMSLYYAHPSTWPSLGFAGPPQPAGFLDFEKPPVRR